MKKYNLTINEEQVQSIMWALDFYSRMKIGQIGVLKDLTGETVGDVVLTRIQKQLFPKLSGLNSSYGIASKNTPEEAKVCYDIYKQIHFVFNPVGVYSYKPMTISKQGLPKFEEIGEPGLLFPDVKNRVKFTRKQKCDVCKKIKKVGFECEDCYNKGFEKTQNTIWDMSREDFFEGVLKILSEHPRSDNYSVNGRLVAADIVIKEKVEKLLGNKTKQEQSFNSYCKGWKSGKDEVLGSWENFMLEFKTKLDLLQHDSATLEICRKDDVEKLIDELSPKFQKLVGEFKK